jgi:hypothetical protein
MTPTEVVLVFFVTPSVILVISVLAAAVIARLDGRR